MLTGLAADPLRRYYHAVARAADLVGVEAVELLGIRYAIWRDPSGTVVGTEDHCPHREAPLSIGTCVNGVVQCVYHGWRFGEDGRCIEVPSAAPGTPVPPRAHLQTVCVAERYGLVWLCPGDPVAEIPLVPEEDNPRFYRINVEVQTWNVSVGRMVDNFLDYSHFPYVHIASFGGATDAEVDSISLEQFGDFHGYRYAVDASNPNEAQLASGTSEAIVEREMSTGFALPFTVRSTIAYASGLHHSLLLCSTPIDEARSSFTFVVWRDDERTRPDEEIIAFDRQIGEE
ncbi:MAG TPA: aromatic ring-hydroxylating dioxygenase subunit alpha, partial [Acidimicrobiales bacterium]|nr:aromatic ring-hydroxylating dioxygenase subunit alpha [Acidimicrobiales bacterium]